MAKRKLKRAVKNKSKSVKPKTSYAFWFFVKALLIAVFIYGGYLLWYPKYYWFDGFAIIAFDLLAILVIKLILRLRGR